MNSIQMPNISPAFAIEDIHKIREWHYEMRKGMTPQEICADTRKGAERFTILLSTPVDTSVQAEINRRLSTVK